MLINEIRNKYSGAIIKQCCEMDCNVYLPKASSRVILKGELLVKHSMKICDCFIFDNRNGLTISLIELKSNRFSPTTICEKFNNANTILCKILKTVNSSKHPIPNFILLTKSNSDRANLKKLINSRINISGKLCRIRTKKCNEFLKDL